MIVMKFGGTSVEDATAMNRVMDIVGGQRERRPVVCVSAASGVTNGLIRLAQLAVSGRKDEALDLVEGLKIRHLAMVPDLVRDEAQAATLNREIDGIIAELRNIATGIALLGELTNRSLDTVVSFGERLSSLVLCYAMNERGIPTDLVDARQVLVTSDAFGAAVPLWDELTPRMRAKLLPIVESDRVALTQGFIGATKDGVTTTLGRGGSDYSAAIFGAALEATDIEIWTDVDGVLTADPSLVKEARRIGVMSFAEAAELAYFGAKVLHPSTILPAVTRQIPVHVRNSRNAERSGTVITAGGAPGDDQFVVKSIAYKEGQTLLNLTSTRMFGAPGFLRAVFRVLDKHDTAVGMIATSEISVSLTIDDPRHIDAIADEMRGFSSVQIEPSCAIVCVVGDGLKNTRGVAGRIFDSVSGVNIKMISQGSSEINVGFVIDERDVPTAVRSLHETFFNDLPNEHPIFH